MATTTNCAPNTAQDYRCYDRPKAHRPQRLRKNSLRQPFSDALFQAMTSVMPIKPIKSMLGFTGCGITTKWPKF